MVSVLRHIRTFVGSIPALWRLALGWGGWRSRRVWVVAGVTVLVAGIVPVLLVSGREPASTLARLPRPVPGVAATGEPPAGATTTPGDTNEPTPGGGAPGADGPGQRPVDG